MAGVRCLQDREFLSSHGSSFEEKEIRTNAEAMRELIEDFNSHATPTRVAGKQVIVGFGPGKASSRTSQPREMNKGEGSMPRRVTALFAVLLLTTSLYAGGPWKDKPYKQWDEKDVRRVLTDSPWAKEICVDATWRGAGVSTPGSSDTTGVGTGGYGQSTAGVSADGCRKKM